MKSPEDQITHNYSHFVPGNLWKFCLAIHLLAVWMITAIAHVGVKKILLG
ncbi:hypothetical protein [[Leptolyngbya] sp. PCC 7376]|nr:hypothetical protein [[Leptolyngbya] sp. PCC 7376]